MISKKRKRFNAVDRTSYMTIGFHKPTAAGFSPWVKIS